MSTFKNIPPEIARILDESIRRIRTIILFRGLFTVATVAAIFMLVSWGMFAALDDIAGWVRWLFWTISVGAVAATTWLSLVRPLLRRYEPWEIAAFIERNHPELEERLSSVVGLASAGDLDVSGRLVEELTHDAVKDAAKVSPKREITTRTMKPWLIAIAVAFSVIAAIAVLFPRFTRNALIFTALPNSEVDNAYASSVSVQPGDATMLAGQPFTVRMVAAGSSLSKAFVRTRVGGGSESVERMEKDPGEAGDKASFAYTYPRVEKSFTYRVKCGGGLTRAYAVKVVPEPAFSERTIEIRHPAYTGRESDRYTNTASVVGLPGSTVRVTFRPSRDDLEGCAVLPGDRTVPATRGEDGLFACEFALGKEVEGSWGLQVWDSNGFSNQLETASIALVADTPPAVKLIQPEDREMKLPTFGELPLAYEIREDFGLSETVLEMCRGAGAWETCETLAPEKKDGVTWTESTVVSFAGKDFGKAGVVRFRVKAADTRPQTLGGPGVAYSPEIAVSLVSKNTSLARQTLSAQISENRSELDEIRKKLESAVRCLETSTGEFDGDQNDWHRGNGKKNLDWAKSNVTAAEGLLSTFIENLSDSRLETGADLFRPVLKDKITPTRQEIEDVYLQARYSEKSDSCRRARTDVQDCLKALAAARNRYEALTKAAENLQKLEDYAQREKALAEMFEQDKIDAKELVEREEELSKKFSEDFKDELATNLDWQKKVAETMKEKTEQLLQRQAELQEKAKGAQTDADRAAVAQAEEQIAREMTDEGRRLGDLAREIEKRTGPSEDDSQATAQPVKDAQAEAFQAGENAKSAAEKMKGGDMDGAQKDMQSAAGELAAAQKNLDAAEGRMDAKNREFAANAQDYKDMQQSLNGAVEAAKTAAAEESAQQAANQQADQNGKSQQKNDQQQNGDAKQQDGAQPQGPQQQPQGPQQQPQGPQQQPQGPQQPSPAQQAAQQAAQNAANKMKQKAAQQAEQSNLSLDQFQPEEASDDAPENENADDRQSSSSSRKGPSNSKRKKRRRPVERLATPQDEGSDWFKMKSDSATGADADNLNDVPEEYRDLVKDYFKALNQGGRK